MASIKRIDKFGLDCSVDIEYDDLDGDGWRIKKISADNKGTRILRIDFTFPVALSFTVPSGNKLAYSCATGEKTKVTVKTTSKSVSKVDIEQLVGISWRATYGI